jgi:hypothetical protein
VSSRKLRVQIRIFPRKTETAAHTRQLFCGKSYPNSGYDRVLYYFTARFHMDRLQLLQLPWMMNNSGRWSCRFKLYSHIITSQGFTRNEKKSQSGLSFKSRVSNLRCPEVHWKCPRGCYPPGKPFRYTITDNGGEAAIAQSAKRWLWDWRLGFDSGRGNRFFFPSYRPERLCGPSRPLRLRSYPEAKAGEAWSWPFTSI